MPRGPKLQLVPLYLPPDLYARLTEEARRDDREETQQAKHILRLHLERDGTGDDRSLTEVSR
jgi:hypothetical protein